MKLFLAIVCFLCSLLLFIRMIQNIRLNQALQLKKETLGYSSKNKLSYRKSIPSLSLLVVCFVLLMPESKPVEPSIQVANYSRGIPLDNQMSIVLNQQVDLIESTQTIDKQQMIGTIIVDEVQYNVVIDKNQLFYLDSNGNIYENRQEE